VITTQAVDIQRASLKRQVRDIANGARNFAMGLRRRMNAMGARDGEGRSADGRQKTAVVDRADEPRAEGDGEVEPAVMTFDTQLSEVLKVTRLRSAIDIDVLLLVPLPFPLS
jgi:predicted DNA-binding protein (UPF0278 family)